MARGGGNGTAQGCWHQARLVLDGVSHKCHRVAGGVGKVEGKESAPSAPDPEGRTTAWGA